ncbi:MAG: hypothetical protein ACD_58C00014G0001, partial [uncultured bacterium]
MAKAITIAIVMVLLVASMAA